jgi:uncharacterized membrane protein
MFGMDNLPAIIIVIFLIAIVFNIFKGMFAKPMLCPNCLTQKKPKTKVKGSILIEIILWLCFIIPGLIYSLWRSGSRFKVCPACNETGMIPLGSPRAQQLLSGK